jgi:hypothetical protein
VIRGTRSVLRLGFTLGVAADPERGHGLGLEALDDQVDAERDRSAT